MLLLVRYSGDIVDTAYCCTCTGTYLELSKLCKWYYLFPLNFIEELFEIVGEAVPWPLNINSLWVGGL